MAGGLNNGKGRVPTIRTAVKLYFSLRCIAPTRSIPNRGSCPAKRFPHVPNELLLSPFSIQLNPPRKSQTKELTKQADFDLSSLSRLLPLAPKSRATLPTPLTACLHLVSPPPDAERFLTQPFNRISVRSLPSACRVFALSVQETSNHDDQSASLVPVSDKLRLGATLARARRGRGCQQVPAQLLTRL